MRTENNSTVKNGIHLAKKGGVYSIVKNDSNGQLKPWMGDSVAFLYDTLMEKNIFPKKFGGDISTHYNILQSQLKNVHGKRVLELAAGSGSAAHFLATDNVYSGIDVSPRLLKRAVKKLKRAGFNQADLYVAAAEELPFIDDSFDTCLCILSLNLFSDPEKVLWEIGRVLVPGGIFHCTVPVPERNTINSTIRGILLSERELGDLCSKHGFTFESNPIENGALLYFRAVAQ